MLEHCSLIVSKFGGNEMNQIIRKLMDSRVCIDIIYCILLMYKIIYVFQQNPIFFDYLGVLCVCNGLPIPKNQGIQTISTLV